MLEALTQQIKSFLQLKETFIANQTIIIITKILFQADVTQINNSALQDLKSFFHILLDIDVQGLSKEKSIQLFEQALLIVQRYQEVNLSVLQDFEFKFRNKIGELRVIESKTPLMTSNTHIERIKAKDAEEILIGLKDFTAALQLIEESQNSKELIRQQDLINSVALKFYHKLAGHWISQKSTSIKEKFKLGLQRNLSEFENAFILAEQKIKNYCRYYLFDEARNILTYDVPMGSYRASAFEITKIFVVLKDLNQQHLDFLQKKGSKTILLWQENRTQLKQMRTQAKADLIKGVDILKIQENLALGFRTILKNIMQNAENLLDPPPEKFCFVAYGSASRGDVAPKSDAELGCIIEKEDPALYEYLKDFLLIVRFEMEALGESDELNRGFHLDAFPRVESKIENSFGINTIDKYCSYAIQNFYEDNTRLRPLFLHGDQSLLQACLKRLYVDKEPCRKVLLQTLKTFQGTSWQPKKGGTSQSFDVKNDFLLPITLVMTQLSYFYELSLETTMHPINLALELFQNGNLADDFAQKIIKTLKSLYQLRVAQQLVLKLDNLDFKVIIEEVMKPLELWLGWITGKNSRQMSQKIHPLYFPDEKGTRLALVQEKNQWHKNLSAHLFSNTVGAGNPEIRIRTLNSGEGFLNPNIAKQLMEKKWTEQQGIEIPLSMDGIPITLNVNSQLSGLDYVSKILTHLLVGFRTPFFEIARIQFAEKAYPGIITQEILGNRLSGKETTFNPHDFGEMFFLSLFLTPAEINFNHLLSLNSTNKLMYMNTAKSFYPSILRENGTYAVLMKNFLYCCDQMKDKIYPTLREIMLSIDSYKLLNAWLDECLNFETQIKKIFSAAEIKEIFKDDLLDFLFKRIGVDLGNPDASASSHILYFREKFISEFYLKITRVQNHLQKNSNTTYLELLKEIDPLLGNYYEFLLEQYSDIITRVTQGQERGNQEKSLEANSFIQPGIQSLQTLQGKPSTVEELSLRKIHSVTEVKIELQMCFDQKQDIKKLCSDIVSYEKSVLDTLKKLPEELKENVFNGLDWAQLTLTDKDSTKFISSLLKIMENVSFRKLHIINCSVLSVKQLKDILKNSPNLQRLTLRKVELKEETDLLRWLSENNLFIEKIHFDDLPQICWKSSKSLKFTSLKELAITGCDKLLQLKLKVSHLEELFLPNQTLTKLRIIAPKLKVLNILGWGSSSELRFIEFLQKINCAQIKKINWDNWSSIPQGAWIKKFPALVFLNKTILSNPTVTHILKLLLEQENLNLNLKNSNIDLLGIRVLAFFLERNYPIASIDLSNNNIDKEAMIILAASLANNKTLISLNLNANQLDDKCLDILTFHLANNHALIELSIKQNAIKKDDAALQLLLRNNQTRKLSLFFASQQGRFNKVCELIGLEGVSFYGKDNQGMTVLHLAAEAGHLALVEWFIQCGLDIYSKNNHGVTPFELAKQNLHHEVMEYLKLFLTQEDQVKLEAEKKEAFKSLPQLETSADIISTQDFTKNDLIGQGSYGSVYKGTYKKNPVAIKQLLNQSLSEDEVKQFEKEAIALSKTHSEYLVRIPGICLESDSYALILEYMTGGSLKQFLQNPESGSWSVRYQIAIDVGAGLSYLHKQNIFHGDLKSPNILLDYQFKAKLSDFGFSALKALSVAFSLDKEGSVRWMAPELFDENPTHTKQCDIYSYGVILWEITSRKRPYHSMRREKIPLWISQGKREEIPQDTPPSMAKLIAKCWDGRAEERPTAEEAAKTLREEQANYKFNS
jgi:tRNA A-37 threonylcarbamoyl transferase component Bud32/ankyrin repeat protein